MLDANFVMTSEKKLIEIQGSAEKEPFSRNEFHELLDLAETGIQSLINIQKSVII